MTYFIEVTTKLERLREYIKILKNLRKKCSLSDFEKDDVLRGALERYLHLSAECAINIGESIILEKGYKQAEFYREVFEVLEKNKIISKRIANNFSEIAKFRNILVHDYVKLDLKKVYEYLQKDLDDFDKFIIAIAKFLKKQK